MAKKGRTFNVGNFEDYVVKKLDAEQRLAGTFSVFIKSERGGMFVTGGKEPAAVFGNSNFHGVLIAGSLRESEEALSVLREAGASIRDIFSEDDFYAKISVDILSGYLKEVLEDLRIPIALAAEFMVLDMISNNLMRVQYSGDIRIDDLNDSDEYYFFQGLYKKSNQDAIKRELERGKIRDILGKEFSKKSLEELKKIALSLKRKMKFNSLNLIS